MNDTKFIDLTDNTIKLIASVDNKRAGLFETLIKLRPLYTLTGQVNPLDDPENAYYHIFFDFDTFADKKEDMIMKMAELQDKDILTILDISDKDLLENEATSSVAAVGAIFASFVTCASAEIQEQVYEHTGRLATIVEWPLFTSEFTKPFVADIEDKDSVNILWYGLNAEIFSIRPYTQITDYNINLYLESKDARNWKLWKKHVSEADIVFLPKTFTSEDENIRILKAEECVKMGKFVVAPALQDTASICMDCDLTEAINIITRNPSKVEKIIKENQKALKRLYDPEASADQLMQALRMAPNDEFSQNLQHNSATIESY